MSHLTCFLSRQIAPEKRVFSTDNKGRMGILDVLSAWASAPSANEDLRRKKKRIYRELHPV